MDQKLITIEQRKFDWLMKYCDMGLEDAHDYFKKLDEIMPKIKIGDKLYSMESSDLNQTTYHELEVLKIIDYNKGRLLVRRTGIPFYEITERIENACYLYTKYEISKSKYKII